MTCRTSEVAVCCSNASVSSSVRARSSFRSRVFFDCNYCLFGEVFHQLDLFVDERMNFLTINGNYADKVLFLKKRYNKDGSRPTDVGKHARRRLNTA